MREEKRKKKRRTFGPSLTMCEDRPLSGNTKGSLPACCGLGLDQPVNERREETRCFLHCGFHMIPFFLIDIAKCLFVISIICAAHWGYD